MDPPAHAATSCPQAAAAPSDASSAGASCPPSSSSGPGAAHFTRSQTRQHFKAAGVLPFAFHCGQPVVLLGAEPVRTGPGGKVRRCMWRDFGGQREAIDTDSEETASREFAEETLGLFGSCNVDAAGVAAAAAAMAQQLRSRQQALLVVHPLKQGEYHMFVAQTPYLDALMFELATAQNALTAAVAGAEKTAFAWVSLAHLLAVVAAAAGRQYTLLLRPTGSAGGRRSAHAPRRMRLHPCFATSLLLAQAAGLEQLVAQAGASSTPRPPPGAPTSPPRAHQPVASAKGRPGKGGKGQHRIRHTLEPLIPAPQQGVCPEHMLYWLSQEPVAACLRGEAALDAPLNLAAAAGAGAAPAAAPPGSAGAC